MIAADNLFRRQAWIIWFTRVFRGSGGKKLHNVLTYFTYRITNAVAEGINSKIQTIKKAACGFHTFENFKTAIFFRCGGLRVYPVTHGIPG